MGLSQVWDSANKLEAHHLAGFRLAVWAAGSPSSQGATAPLCLRAGYELVHDREERWWAISGS